MGEQQLHMYDVLMPIPPMWECKETCKHFGESVDYPSWWFGEARCTLCNTSNMKVVSFDNRGFVYCELYERREDDAGNG